MKKLFMLILCLLVTFKVISQKDTTNYVILTEFQAKKVIKDLIHMDALEEINVSLEDRIRNFLIKENIYKNTILTKDSIIDNKDIIIALKDEILNAKKPLEFHSYIGARSYKLEKVIPLFYYRVALEIRKINIGGIVNFQPSTPIDNNFEFDYGIYVEYKLF